MATRDAWPALFLLVSFLVGAVLCTPVPQDAEGIEEEVSAGEEIALTPEEEQKFQVTENITALVLGLMDKNAKEDCFRRLVCQLEKERLADPETFKTANPNPPAILTLLSEDFPHGHMRNAAVRDRYFYYFVAKQAAEIESSDCEQIYNCSATKEEVLKDAARLSGEFTFNVCDGDSCSELENADQSNARKMLDNIEIAETEDCFKRLICELEQENSEDIEAFNTKYPNPPNILTFVDNNQAFENHPIKGTLERFEVYLQAQRDGLIITNDCKSLFNCSLTQEKVLEEMYALPWK